MTFLIINRQIKNRDSIKKYKKFKS